MMSGFGSWPPVVDPLASVKRWRPAVLGVGAQNQRDFWRRRRREFFYVEQTQQRIWGATDLSTASACLVKNPLLPKSVVVLCVVLITVSNDVLLLLLGA